MSSEATFNYKDKSATKLTDDFKRKFTVNIKGKDAIKLEGLTAIAHEKGMWKFETEIVQYPSDSNQWTAICKTTIGGYDYDPTTEKIREVVYSDIGDANANNCGKMVAAAFIRMASTRSQARALRKYTNIDMVCTSEMDSVTEEPSEPQISMEQLTEVKNLVRAKNIDSVAFGNMLFTMFNHQNYMQLTANQGNILISTLQAYVAPDSSQN